MHLTALMAASSKSSAAITFTPDSLSTFFPSSTLVPAKRTTKGTLRFTVFTASTMPVAMVSH